MCPWPDQLGPKSESAPELLYCLTAQINYTVLLFCQHCSTASSTVCRSLNAFDQLLTITFLLAKLCTCWKRKCQLRKS